MRVKDKLHLRFNDFFISAAIATLNGINRLRLKWFNAHNPALTATMLGIDKRDVRVVSELNSENLFSRTESVIQIAEPLHFLRRRHRRSNAQEISHGRVSWQACRGIRSS